MIAIIEKSGKQYKVEEGSVIKVNRIKEKKGVFFEIKKIKAIFENNNVYIGKPNLKNTSVTCEVLEHKRDKKIVVFKYKNKTGYRRKKGHRQDITLLKISKINFSKKES